MSTEIPTQIAGIFLLVRAALDARLPWLIKETNYPPQNDLPQMAPLLLSLGMSWAGTDALKDGELDKGLGAFAGLSETPTLNSLQNAWNRCQDTDHQSFQRALLRILVGQRLIKGNKLYLHKIPISTDQFALVAGDGDSQIWPLGKPLTSYESLDDLVSGWQTTWANATGKTPTLVINQKLANHLSATTRQKAEIVATEQATNSTEETTAVAYNKDKTALTTMFSALHVEQIRQPTVDLTTTLTANALIRLWARWLRQFASSTTPYILDNFIRRPGTVRVEPTRVVVTMASRPLDSVLEMAGYFEPLERVPWLNGRVLHFKVMK